MSALRASGVVTWNWDIAEDAIWWDEHLHQFFGIETRDFLGGFDSFTELVHPQDRDSFRDRLAAALRDRTDYEIRFRILSPDGNVRFVQSRGQVECNSEGMAVGVTGVCWDISEAQRAEEKLRESETRVELLQSMIEAAVAISSAPTVLETAARVGEKASEIIGARAGVRLTFNGAPESLGSDGPSGDHSAWATLGAQERAIRMAQQEFELHPSCEAILQEITGSGNSNGLLVVPLRGREGRSLGVLWLGDKQAGPFSSEDERAVTHLAQLAANTIELHRVQNELESRVAERTEHLARSNVELEQFAYVASHDLQEPLRTIAGYCELACSSGSDQLNQECQGYLRQVVEGVKQMQCLITGLLELSRVRSRAKAFELIDTQAILAKILDNLGETIAASGAIITTGELPAIHADGSQIQQVLQHLLENALKFRGSRTPVIHVDARLMDGDWQFSVADNGIGIDPQYAERLFVIFQRLHTRAKYAGAGIGLALCKKVVQRHGGRIWLESELDRGTTLYFTIPQRGTYHAYGSGVAPRL